MQLQFYIGLSLSSVKRSAEEMTQSAGEPLLTSGAPPMLFPVYGFLKLFLGTKRIKTTVADTSGEVLRRPTDTQPTPPPDKDTHITQAAGAAPSRSFLNPS